MVQERWFTMFQFYNKKTFIFYLWNNYHGPVYVTTREYSKIIIGKNINIFVIYYINEQTDTNLPVHTLKPAFIAAKIAVSINIVPEAAKN